MTEKLVKAFKNLLPCGWEPLQEQVDVLSKLIDFAQEKGYQLRDDFESVFMEAVNQKLDLNRNSYQNILDAAFSERIKLNYILKSRIKKLLDKGDSQGFERFLEENGISSPLLKAAFTPAAKQQTLEALKSICLTDTKHSDVCSSIFSRFCFHLFPETCAYSYFSNGESGKEDFFDFVINKYPDMAARDKALYVLDVQPQSFISGYNFGCNTILHEIRESFNELNNHCILAVHIPKIPKKGEDFQWRLFADIILFAEKHDKGKIDRSYFRWQKIEQQTTAYIKGLIPSKAEFEYAFQGFVFKDCFILGSEEGGYSLLLILEKNIRDERAVYCPACRSSKIQGNSYPILNVRSWECENPLCPDRSRYNRGKRYAFMSLFRQKEMQNDDNIIPEYSISKWHLDCQLHTSKREAFDMVVKHYSCVGDTVHFIADKEGADTLFGRNIVFRKFGTPKLDLLESFKTSSFFYRYIQTDNRESKPSTLWQSKQASVYHGDCLDVLRSLRDESIDCSVTSPPYYNAKSYSQWPNIYCYLYDMYNICSELFRVLKPGGVFLFNIFDYFDNENNIVFSAMGNKRMILGAYMLDIFERIGFTVAGNIIWNKGEIQGNRSFNQGNLTPYYQAPLNCWEHIFVLSKGEVAPKFEKLTSSIANFKPVIKMVRGKNVLGHDAPYPHDLPELLVKHMDEGDIVLDPFLGSGTTCIVANRIGRSSVGVEKSEEYFHLCQHLIEKDCYQPDLFS